MGSQESPKDDSQSPRSSYGPELVAYLEALPDGAISENDPAGQTDLSLIPAPNWVDPDILAYNEMHGIAIDDHKAELDFKKFFEEGWLNPKYDHLRERWDPLIYDEEPQGRLMGKTALWSLVQLMEIRERKGTV